MFELSAAFTERPETRTELQYLSQNAELLVADIGATVAGIAYLNYVLFPSAYTDFLYVGDIFRVAALVTWGIGTIRVISQYQEAYANTGVLEEPRRGRARHPRRRGPGALLHRVADPRASHPREGPRDRGPRGPLAVGRLVFADHGLVVERHAAAVPVAGLRDARHALGPIRG
jgi:hypothetical protein